MTVFQTYVMHGVVQALVTDAMKDCDPCDPPQYKPPSWSYADPLDDLCDSWAFIPKD